MFWHYTMMNHPKNWEKALCRGGENKSKTKHTFQSQSAEIMYCTNFMGVVHDLCSFSTSNGGATFCSLSPKGALIE